MKHSEYVRERRKLFKSLADHCHDKALEASSPYYVARWMVLMDAALWLRCPDAEIDVLESLCHDPDALAARTAKLGEVQ